MNPQKTEVDLFHHYDLQSQLSISQNHDPDDSPFSLPEILLYRSSSSSSSASAADGRSHSSSENEDSTSNPNRSSIDLKSPNYSLPYISPDSHVSSQFYTFNSESHSLMIHCILERRLATPAEIRVATPEAVLKSWRSVWKDRCEDTAYLTAWKRIQDKLDARVDTVSGNELLCFKNNSQQFVSHINQWQDIVMSFHGDGDLRHLGLKETLDRIKQVWTVGAKFYGIPESYIKVCVAACPVCNVPSGSASRSKRRRFEYTESFDVPAKDVPCRLQQLAAKHKVVLCIRQKYIRYKPFMAEVKDYACHRAGEPASKKSRIVKREPYASKRCGCGFRIRAIVPIANYNEKDRTFVYEEDGMAVFKLYAVHTGHQPGPLDGNARIMHRVVGYNGALMTDQDLAYGVREDIENERLESMLKDEGDLYFSVLQHVQVLKTEIGLLEGRVRKIPPEMLGSVSDELSNILNKVRSLGEEGSKSTGSQPETQNFDRILVEDNDLENWASHAHNDQLYGDGKESELLEDPEHTFGRTLGDVISWDHVRTEFRSQKDLMGEPCKPDGKWLKCSDFDEKSILDCEDTKLTKPMRHDESIVTDVGLVGIQVDSFYLENPKWYDSPCGLDTSTNCGEGGIKPDDIL